MFSPLTSNWYIFFPLAVALYVALQLSEGRADLRSGSLSVRVIRQVIALLLVLALMAVGMRGFILGIAWLILLGVLAGIISIKLRRLQRTALLLTAVQATTEMQQLSVCESFWCENRGWLRRLAGRLRSALASGQTWWTALEQHQAARGIYGKMTVRLAGLGNRQALPLRAGQTQAVAQTLLKPLHIEGEAERLLGRLLIFSWVLYAFPLVIGFYLLVLPTLRRMVAEFGMSPPWMLEAVTDLAYNASRWGWASVLYVLPVAMAGILIIAAAAWLFPQLLHHWPLRWLCGDYFRAAGFTALSHALASDSNLIAACRTAGQLISVPHIARPYEHAARLLEAGHTPDAAFERAGLINKRERQALAGGHDPAHPVWALQQLSRWKVERMFRRYWIAIQWAVVLITLLLAFLVGGLAMAMFQFLAELILNLDTLPT